MMKRNLLAVFIAYTLCGGAVGQETNPTTTDQWPQGQQKPQAEEKALGGLKAELRIGVLALSVAQTQDGVGDAQGQ